MCWKWKYSCGHTADLECSLPRKDPYDPQDAILTHYCLGPPTEYTAAPTPCQKCLIQSATTRSSNGNNKDGNDGNDGNGNGTRVNGNNVNGSSVNGNSVNGNTSRAQFDGGSGNNSFCGTYAAGGWINKDLIGVAPWDKEWMIPAAGMKLNDEGEIVDDPASYVERLVKVVQNETYQFDPDGRYDHFLHPLEAVSNHQAYANIPSSFTMVKPKYDFVAARLKEQYPNTIDFDNYPAGSPFKAPVLSPASSRSVSTATSFSSSTEAEPVDDISPATQASFSTTATSVDLSEEKWLAERKVFERGQTEAT